MKFRSGKSLILCKFEFLKLYWTANNHSLKVTNDVTSFSFQLFASSEDNVCSGNSDDTLGLLYCVRCGFWQFGVDILSFDDRLLYIFDVSTKTYKTIY